MIFVQKSNFFHFGFFGVIKSEKKNVFIFWKEKNDFRPENLCFKTCQKVHIFLRG